MEHLSGIVIFIIGFMIFKSIMMKPLDLSTDNQILKSVNLDEAFKLFEEGINIIDVRTAGEFSDSRLKNAKNCDIYNNKFKEKLSKFDKNKKYLIYCQNGFRSRNALKIMKNLGFKETYELRGGITTWINGKKPVITSKSK